MSFTYLKALSALVITASFVTGCATVKPDAPIASYKQPITKMTVPSVFNIPVEVSLAEVQKQINNQVGAVMYDDNSLDNNGGDNLIVNVKKRQPIQITSSNGALFFKVPVSVYAKAGYKAEKFGFSLAKYEDTNFDIDLNFKTTISVDANWVVSTNTSTQGYNWITKPVLKVAGFEIPLTPVAEKILDYQLPQLTKLVDAEVKKNLDLKPHIQKVWNEIQDPILVNKDYSAWLKISPESMVMTPLSTKNNNVRMTLGLEAITESWIGSKPPVKVANKLPLLKTDERITERFQVSLLNLVTFDILKDLAKKQAEGQTFVDGKRRITITGIDLYGRDNKLVVVVDMAGSLSGRIYLMGKPVFDATTEELVLDELDYSLETKSALAKSADWLAHGKFVKMMTPYFRVSVKSQIEDARKTIMDNLNKPIARGVQLKGTLKDLKPGQMVVTERGIQTEVTFSGNLNVLIDGLD